MERQTDVLSFLDSQLQNHLRKQMEDKNKSLAQGLLNGSPKAENFIRVGNEVKALEESVDSILVEMSRGFKGWARRLRSVGLTIPTLQDLTGESHAQAIATNTEPKVIQVKESTIMTYDKRRKLNQEIGRKLPDETLIEGLYYWNKNFISPADRKEFKAEITPVEWIDWMNQQNPVMKGYIRSAIGRAKGAIKTANISKEQGYNFYPTLVGIETLGQLRQIVSGNPKALGDGCVGTTLFLEQAFRKTEEDKEVPECPYDSDFDFLLDDDEEIEDQRADVPSWGLSKEDWALQPFREAILNADLSEIKKGEIIPGDIESISGVKSNLRDAAWTLNKGVKWLLPPMDEKQVWFEVLNPDLPEDLPEGSLYKLSRAFKIGDEESLVKLDEDLLDQVMTQEDILDARTFNALIRHLCPWRGGERPDLTVRKILSVEVYSGSNFAVDVRNIGELGFYHLLVSLAKKGIIPQT